MNLQNQEPSGRGPVTLPQPTTAQYQAKRRIDHQARVVRQEIAKLLIAVTGAPDELVGIWTATIANLHQAMEAATMRTRTMTEGWDQ